MKNRLKNKTTRNNFITYGVVILIYIVMQILTASGSISSTMQGLLVPICAYVVMAISLNLTVGILGELSLGHAGFMSVGAFTGVTAAMALSGRVSSGICVPASWAWSWARCLRPSSASSSASPCCG